MPINISIYGWMLKHTFYTWQACLLYIPTIISCIFGAEIKKKSIITIQNQLVELTKKYMNSSKYKCYI